MIPAPYIVYIVYTQYTWCACLCQCFLRKKTTAWAVAFRKIFL